MNAIAEKMNIKTAHFIQPAPAISKTLTPEEIDVIGDLGYKEDYLKLEHEMMTLRDEGIPMHSMLHVLENVNETIYRDTLHFCEKMETGESLGSRILGEKMAEGLAKTFRLTKKEEPTTVA